MTAGRPLSAPTADPDDQTAPMRSSEECLLKAAQQYAWAAKAPEGPIRDSFLEMADTWRRLADAKPPLMNLWR